MVSKEILIICLIGFGIGNLVRFVWYLTRKSPPYPLPTEVYIGYRLNPEESDDN